MIDRKYFYDNFRVKFEKLKQSQVDGFETFFNEWDARKLRDLRWLSYMLATTWHETDRTMQPIEEYGKGRTKKYGKRIKYSGATYTDYTSVFYGRGYVQLTWYEVYEKMGKLLGYNFLKSPELLLVPHISVKVVFEGMLKDKSGFGDFTGVSLERYFNDKVNDPFNARKIINGLDKARKIANEHNLILQCLRQK